MPEIHFLVRFIQTLRTLLSGPGLTRIDEEDRLLYVGGDVLVPGVDIMNQFSAVIYG
jgi:hypothetical protein